MIKNFLKIAFRNKGFSLINISGLAIGMAIAILILLWIQNEIGYDRFYKKIKRIYTLNNQDRFNGELGARNTTPKILGASALHISSLLSVDFLKLVFISLLIASPIAWQTMNQWLKNYEYQIKIEWWIFVLTGVLSLLIALATVSYQSLKAAMANPVKSLRAE